MAEALTEVRQSQRAQPGGEKRGRTEKRLSRWAGYLDRGLATATADVEEVRRQVQRLREVAACLDEAAGPAAERPARFEELAGNWNAAADTPAQAMAEQMLRWQPGLFVGEVALGIPVDNLELERWFQRVKGHERRIHGRAHAGVRIVQEGPTLVLTLDAHGGQTQPFTAEQLQPYRKVPMPECQRQALHRRTVMRRARSGKQRPRLLAELERRYQSTS
jgi:hypothetical protein